MHGCTTWIGEVGLGHIPNPTPPLTEGHWDYLLLLLSVSTRLRVRYLLNTGPIDTCGVFSAVN